MGRKFNFLILILLAIWTSYVIFLSLTGDPVFFPLQSFTPDNVPYYRMQVLRISIFVTVTYFTSMHILDGNRRYRAIQFLKIYLNILVIVTIIIFSTAEKVSRSDLNAIFGIIALTLLVNLAARPTIRKYFNRR